MQFTMATKGNDRRSCTPLELLNRNLVLSNCIKDYVFEQAKSHISHNEPKYTSEAVIMHINSFLWTVLITASSTTALSADEAVSLIGDLDLNLEAASERLAKIKTSVDAITQTSVCTFDY